MAAIVFTNPDPEIRQGLDRCVVYRYPDHEVWLGMVTLETEVDGDLEVVTYVDGVGRRSQVVLTGFQATVQAYTYPELMELGSFGMTYRTFVKEDVYDLHLVYGCKGVLADRSYYTLTNDPGLQGFQVSLSTVPEKMPANGFRPASHLVIRSSGLWTEALEHLEGLLYGTADTDPQLPSIDDVIEILETYVSLRIRDYGDGTWSAEEINTTGIIKMVAPTEFAIDWDSARFIGDETYTIHSL